MITGHSFPLKFSLENWQTDNGYLVAYKDKLILGNLYLPPSEYHFSFKLHGYRFAEPQIILNEDKRIVAGVIYHNPIKTEKPSMFGKLIKKIADRDSLFLAIIISFNWNHRHSFKR